MNSVTRFFQRFLKSEGSGASSSNPIASAGAVSSFAWEELGQDLIEYALLAALLGLGAVSSMKGLSVQISNSFSNVSNTFANATVAPSQGGGDPGHHDDH